MKENSKGFLKILTEKCKFIKSTGFIVFLGIAGMLMILFSESKDKNPENIQVSESGLAYEKSLEIRMEDILKKIEGVGNVSVMITAEGTEENIYAREIRENTQKDGEKDSSQKEETYIIVRKDGDMDALVKKTINPVITGVVVICDGGSDNKIREKVYNAVSVSLGISASRIYVAGTE